MNKQVQRINESEAQPFHYLHSNGTRHLTMEEKMV